MGPFKRILVAVDGSENSIRAVETAKNLAEEGMQQIGLIHVVQPVYQTVGSYGYVDVSTMITTQTETGQRILAEAKELINDVGVEVDTRLVVGRRGQEICKFAKSGEYDLIVMGRRGLGRLEEVVLGSVSEYVVRHSDLPVLIVQ